jgi:hypothetical protein
MSQFDDFQWPQDIVLMLRTLLLYLIILRFEHFKIGKYWF